MGSVRIQLVRKWFMQRKVRKTQQHMGRGIGCSGLPQCMEAEASISYPNGN